MRWINLGRCQVGKKNWHLKTKKMVFPCPWHFPKSIVFPKTSHYRWQKVLHSLPYFGPKIGFFRSTCQLGQNLESPQFCFISKFQYDIFSQKVEEVLCAKNRSVTWKSAYQNLIHLSAWCRPLGEMGTNGYLQAMVVVQWSHQASIIWINQNNQNHSIIEITSAVIYPQNEKIQKLVINRNF